MSSEEGLFNFQAQYNCPQKEKKTTSYWGPLSWLRFGIGAGIIGFTINSFTRLGSETSWAIGSLISSQISYSTYDEDE